MLRTYVGASLALDRWRESHIINNERGQATAEYVLLLLGAAAVALLVLAWATKTTKISSLLNKVIEALISRVT